MDVCIPNINTQERRKRLIGGLVSLLISLIILSVMTYFGIERWWRLLLFPLFASAAIGYYQWREKT